MTIDHGAGFNSVENTRSTGHSPGVPVLQLPARDQHKRIILVWFFVGRFEVSRHKSSTTVCGRETFFENHTLTRIGRFLTWIGYAVLTFQSFPGHAGNTWHCITHFIKNIANIGVFPFQP